ncbi:DUF5994 family protein [Kitasatospora aureofaciens]|uniref:Uncharacterized protein n=1 Tax=Kitasatospora aureofaciens TaxID=1894 RepID=A0A1E7MZ60_KITAU|nr:DUF5994 family protein [Kitasatospora aureofaciens]QEV00810.1 hypothetical protein CP971_17500 [Streptomyces viridifaciens]ARF79620.1 hypothetical protein B6264_12495 [Kitasatospora aureofaciens]OEV33717.1 hypothetical protein HS99_0038230 [Kitasatospora aureofaciens]UKZ07118.1 DUF5994 family protein [Streptomyces viridifaciens]GGU64753.1 hypothetical protein GCM10010502_14420 [Kitasatospora aureofaciens]
MTEIDGATLATAELAPRFSLTPDGPRAGRLDGAWWPRSHDLPFELPALAAELNKRWGRVAGITVNPAQWLTVPRRIPIAGRTVHVSHTVHAGGFTAVQDQHTISVRSHLARRLTLLVVPPRTGAVEAARLMAEAADPANTGTASELLAEEPSARVSDRRGIIWPVRDPSVSAWGSARWGGPLSPGCSGLCPRPTTDGADHR